MMRFILVLVSAVLVSPASFSSVQYGSRPDLSFPRTDSRCQCNLQDPPNAFIPGKGWNAQAVSFQLFNFQNWLSATKPGDCSLHRQMVFPQNGADRITKLQNIGLNSLPTMPGVFLCLNGFYEGMALGQGSLDKATWRYSTWCLGSGTVLSLRL